MPDIFETIMHRRSIRRFALKQIKEAALQQILQAGLSTPPRSQEKRDVSFVSEVNGNEC